MNSTDLIKEIFLSNISILYKLIKRKQNGKHKFLDINLVSKTLLELDTLFSKLDSLSIKEMSDSCVKLKEAASSLLLDIKNESLKDDFKYIIYNFSFIYEYILRSKQHA